VILIVLLIGAEFFGLLGMFLAAPVAAVVRELVYFYVVAPRRRRLIADGVCPPGTVANLPGMETP
jgi:hypothetical protein